MKAVLSLQSGLSLCVSSKKAGVNGRLLIYTKCVRCLVFKKRPFTIWLCYTVRWSWLLPSEMDVQSLFHRISEVHLFQCLIPFCVRIQLLCCHGTGSIIEPLSELKGLVSKKCQNILWLQWWLALHSHTSAAGPLSQEQIFKVSTCKRLHVCMTLSTQRRAQLFI